MTPSDIWGVLFGRNILTPRQLPVARREWLHPTHDAFKPRTRWSLYNAATAALKTTPPNRIMERHIGLHNLLAPTTVEA